MRIKKIKKIDSASFDSFSSSALDNFSDLNIVFGWNGTGKTVLSRILRSFEVGENYNSNWNYKIKINNTVYSEQKLGKFNNQIKVFNKDYVSDIFQSDNDIDVVFYAGEEEISYDKKEKEIESLEKNLDKINCKDGSKEIARSVVEKINASSLSPFSKEDTSAKFNSYDLKDFKKRVRYFDEIDKELSDFILEKEKTSSLLESLKNSNQIKQSLKKLKGANEWLGNNVKKINKGLKQVPKNKKSKRITSFSKRESNWIKEGKKLHFHEDKKSNCIFCTSIIEKDVVDEIKDHFNREVVDLDNNFSNYIQKVESYLQHLKFIEEIDHPEVNKVFSKIFKVLSDFKESLKNKQEKSYEVSLKKINYNSTEIEESISEIEDSLSNLGNIAIKLEKHFVADKYKDYKNLKEDYKKCIENKKDIKEKIKIKKEEIKKLKEKALSVHKPVAKINQILKRVFPEKEIEIKKREQNTKKEKDQLGYVLYRKGKEFEFDNLSEGEKNVLALSYFITSLGDKNFDKEGVVVIDDPASSLDKNCIFTIFAMISQEIRKNDKSKNSENRQFFVLTHNLDFLEHIQEEFSNKINNSKASVFQVKHKNKTSVVSELHSLLKNYKSDYYFIYEKLKSLEDDCDPEETYVAANLLRRWLEMFLGFKFAKSRNYKQKLKAAYKKAKDDFDGNLQEMYRFTSYGSHDSEKTILQGPDESMMNNASNYIQEAFELGESLDPIHFKSLNDL